VTIALLSNVTVTSLAMRLNKASREEVYCPSGFNTWLQEISEGASKLYGNKPAAVFILLHGRELLGEAGCENPETAKEILSPLAETLADTASAHPETVFVASTLDIPARKIRPLISRRAEQRASAFWRASLEDRGIPILDLSEMACDMGREHFYNNRVWYMGSIPFSKSGEDALVTEITRIWRAIRGSRKKCLALDLDGTLWGGAIGEMGVEGVHLDTTGSGARFRDFQRRILDIKESGALLAIISKNNSSDALSGVRNHPAMLLKEEDFAAIRTNWAPKPENLISIAEELNIGTDSFVFIDDNPIERETMQITLPEVTVPNFPADSAQLERFMIDVAREYFLQFRSTDEDMKKTEQYRAEAGRRERRSAYSSVEEYLASLEMTLSVEGLTGQNIPRAAQLTQKTNQFNLTARRLTEAEMHTIADDASSRAYIGQLSDRFGDYGKIALCLARISGKTAGIEIFLMSCRVMGRGVESAFLQFVERDLSEAGVTSITSEYVPTLKNSVVRDFWNSMGYEETGGSDGTVRYIRRIEEGTANRERDAQNIKISKKEAPCRSS
jgi:FkbH-like protein